MRDLFVEIGVIGLICESSEALETKPSRTSTMELFCKNNLCFLAVNCFHKKVPSYIFGWVVNTPLKLPTFV